MVEIIGLGGERDSSALKLSTCKGRPIKNTRRLPLIPAIMKAAAEMHTASHSSAKLRSLSSEYNCMGMVFASRRAEIDVGELPTILQDDEYIEVAPNKVERGDVLVYKDAALNPTHVGIVYSHSPNVCKANWDTTVLSQWGRDGEYFHSAADVSPLLGKPIEFWTDRKA